VLYAFAVYKAISNETCAPTANLPNSALPFPQVTYGSVQYVARDRQTITQMAMTNIHFASAMPHAKCNKIWHLCTTIRMLPELPKFKRNTLYIEAGS